MTDSTNGEVGERLRELLVPQATLSSVHIWQGAQHRAARRRRRARQLWLGASLVAAIALVLVTVRVSSFPGAAERSVAAAAPKAPRAPEPIALGKGILATPLEPGRYHVVSGAPAQVVLAIESGVFHFDIAPEGSGSLLVHAKDLQIEDIGTVFEVAVRPEHVSVSVQSGSVRVKRGQQITVLAAGESRSFEGTVTARPEPSAASVAAAEAPSWQKLAREGQYQRAYDAATKRGAAAVRDEPQERLLWADVLRLSGHPAEAVAVLRAFEKRYPSDPRAMTATFTLGRVLMDELGQPAAAAEAFVRAERMSGAGGLARDALARSALAYHRAGQTERSREAAQRYLARYPRGPHRAVLEKLARGR